jgi:hypothetical protein
MKDSRSLERFVLQVPAKIVHRSKGGDENSIKAVTKDLSAAGAYFYSKNDQVEVGETIEIEVTLTIEKLRLLLGMDEEVILKADGRVIRKSEDGFAVNFKNRLKIRALY